MSPPQLPSDEERRLKTLENLQILDTMHEECFDRITRLASRLFDVPIVLVSLVDRDRQWFKSNIGLDAPETSRDISFCGHAILQDGVFSVIDAARDPRFHDNPLVTGDLKIRFYAGKPLKMADGSQIGTLCIMDRRPRMMSPADLDSLKDLAMIVENELQAHMLANTDPLTEMLNRRGFSRCATRVLSTSRDSGQPASLVFFDLDGFKLINDTFGHSAGDEALKIFARCMKTSFRGGLCARIGGDEFCVLVDASPVVVPPIIKRLKAALLEQGATRELPFTINFSAGATEFLPAQHDCIGALIAESDELMYANKQRNKLQLEQQTS